MKTAASEDPHIINFACVTLLDSDNILPVVIISHLPGDEFTSIYVHEIISSFCGLDDVHNAEFEDKIVLMSYSDMTARHAAERMRAKESNIFSAIYYSSAQPQDLLPSGRYFLHGNNIHQAWRLYEDDLDAFVFAVLPCDVRNPVRYQAINSLAPDGIWRHVPVPSRLYAKPTADRPLLGARIALKDIYQLAGVKSTIMNRAFTELYEPDNESANYLEKLIRLGATIVGKTKMASFASSEEPTDQWIDFHCPVNPRGGRYQSLSGSSSGAAAALAGYSWLDYSVGSDYVHSAGSIRAPATCNGLFSLRPSFNSTPMTGIAINSPVFGVVVHFSRSLDDLKHIVSTILDLPSNWKGFPTKILYSTDLFPHSNSKHQEMIKEFIYVLEELLGVKRENFSIAERWAQCPPTAANGRPLNEYLAKSAFLALCKDYNKMFEPFRNEYRAKYGKEAYEGTIVCFRWDIGKNVADEQYMEYLEKLKVFREWFNDKVLSSNSDNLSDTIMIMPYGSANPKYRDSPNELPTTSNTFGEKFISPILQMPQLVVPFGKMPYESRISGRVEYRPIASTIVGAKGSDIMLIELAKSALEKACWPTKVDVGRFMYPLGDNTRNVGDPSEAATS